MDNQNLRQPGGKRGRIRGQRVQNPNPQLFEDTSTQPPGGYGMPQMPDMQQANAPGHYDYEGEDQDQVYPNENSENQGTNMGGYNPQQQPPPQAFPPQGGYAQPPQQGYGGQPQQPFPGQQYLNDPMANMAMQYGTQLADTGKDMVQKNLEKYGVSPNKLKYYFAVDTTYVGKKLGLLLFPFAHSDYSIRYDQNEPVQPRYEINAPDLYIPAMAFVSYILLAGVALGMQNRFTPEQLGITSSTALVWLVIEIMVLLLTTYIMNVSTDLKYLDLLSYCGYKYVGMILSVLAGLFFNGIGYYVTLLWTGGTLAFFLVRSLKVAIIPHTDSDTFTHGNKRRTYMLLVIALSQPLFMWWLTYHLVH